MDSGKKPAVISEEKDMLKATEKMLYESEVPVFLLSSVSGRGLEEFKYFLRLLHKPFDWTSHSNEVISASLIRFVTFLS
jgi:GTPase